MSGWNSGSIASLDSALHPIVESAGGGQSGREEVYRRLNSGVKKWRIEYAPVAASRSLFLLQSAPPRRVQPDADQVWHPISFR